MAGDLRSSLLWKPSTIMSATTATTLACGSSTSLPPNDHAPMFSRFDRLAAMCLLHRQHEIIQLEERIGQNLENPQGVDHLLRSLTPLLLEYCNVHLWRLNSEG